MATATGAIEAGPSTSVVEIDLKEEETEFFGITPVSYVDTVINHLNDFLFDCVDIMQKKLVAEGNFTGKEVQQSLDRFLVAAQASVDKQFDLFELYVLKNIFVVRPEWNNEGYKFDEENEVSSDDIVKLKGQIESAIQFNEKMRREKEELDMLQSLIEKASLFIAEFEKMQKASQLESWPLLNESVAQLLSDAARLRVLIPKEESGICSQEIPAYSSESIDVDAAATFASAMK